MRNDVSGPLLETIETYPTCRVSMQAEAFIEILECGEAVDVGNRVCSDFAGPA